MDSTLSGLLMLGATVLFVVLLIKLITKPIKWVLKLLVHALFGYLLLWLVNFLGVYVGLQIEMSAFHILLASVFGVPGVALLVLAQFIF